ncbi:hypothetical protein D3C85_1333470 [compost metagenome]
MLLTADDLFNFLAFLKDQSRLFNNLSANFSRYNGLFAAVEDFYIQHFFQLLYLHAQGWLSHKTLFCGANKTSVGVYCHVVFQLN